MKSNPTFPWANLTTRMFSIWKPYFRFFFISLKIKRNESFKNKQTNFTNTFSRPLWFLHIQLPGRLCPFLLTSLCRKAAYNSSCPYIASATLTATTSILKSTYKTSFLMEPTPICHHLCISVKCLHFFEYVSTFLTHFLQSWGHFFFFDR